MPPLIPLALQLAQFVPAIARWLSSDHAEPIAGQVLEVAQTIAGTSSPADAVKALLGDADKQQAFTLAMQDKADELERAYLADRSNARQRDVEIRKTTAGGANQRADNLAYLAILGLIGCIALIFATILLKLTIDAAAEKMLYLLTGALIVLVKDVYGFEFGSSKDSQRNQQSLSNLLTTNGNGNGNGAAH